MGIIVRWVVWFESDLRIRSSRPMDCASSCGIHSEILGKSESQARVPSLEKLSRGREACSCCCRTESSERGQFGLLPSFRCKGGSKRVRRTSLERLPGVKSHFMTSSSTENDFAEHSIKSHRHPGYIDGTLRTMARRIGPKSLGIRIDDPPGISGKTSTHIESASIKHHRLHSTGQRSTNHD